MFFPSKVAAGLLLVPWVASGALFSLENDLDSETINGGLFILTDNPSPSGADILSLRDDNGAEAGHNTSGATVNDEQFAAAVMMSEMACVTVGQVNYFEFLLDANENGPGDTIVLESLLLFYSPTNGLVYDDAGGVPADGDLGTLAYDFDGNEDNTLTFTNINPGSNQPDIRILIPKSVFGGAVPTDSVYLYASLSGVAAGDEDFSLGVPVPEPASTSLSLLALAFLSLRRRRRR